MPLEHLILIASGLLVFSVVASKLTDRFGVPAMLLFLALGMLAGSDGLGGIYFDDVGLAQSLGVIALALILFSGGLETKWSAVRSVAPAGIIMSTAGVLITASLVAVFTHLVLGLSLLDGLLLGSIVSSTDAAAVFAIVNTPSTRLKNRLARLLELESGSNDPMAIFLTTSVIRLIGTPDLTPLDLVGMFVQQMVVGLVAGLLFGYLMVRLINALDLEQDGLYPVLTLALGLLAYALTSVFGGNPFLAVYISGIVLGNHDFIHKNSLTRFHDGMAWLMQIVMFLTLGLLVFPSRLPSVAVNGLLVSAFLILVARPVSVFAGLALARFDLREKTFISWVGLRGAAPIILATFPLLAGVPQADVLFHLVFFVVLSSVVLQGSSIRPVARALGAQEPAVAKPRTRLSVEGSSMKNQLVELVVPERGTAVGNRILDLHLPESSLIILIGRGQETIVPRGNTVLEPGDSLVVLVDPDMREITERLLLHEAPDPTSSP